MQSSCLNRLHFLILFCGLTLAGCSSVPLDKPASSATSPRTQASAKPRVLHQPVLPAAGSGRGGYYKDDGPGDVTPDGLLELPDADPRVEPYSIRSNKPYAVFGKRYTPMIDDRPFKERGYGSWYGKKFHGQKTSSGELYDMYKMSAAHPTLPIPSYARITNLSNGKQVIVRINDRGPFHSSRVVDVSYTAALKLGYIGHGSAELQVERLLPAEIAQMIADKDRTRQPGSAAAMTLTAPEAAPVSVAMIQTTPLAQPDQRVTEPALPGPALQESALSESALSESALPESASLTPSPVSGFYLQFGAFSRAASAETVRARLAEEAGDKLPQLKVEQAANLYRLFSGPFASRGEAVAAAARLQDVSTSKPFIVQR